MADENVLDERARNIEGVNAMASDPQGKRGHPVRNGHFRESRNLANHYALPNPRFHGDDEKLGGQAPLAGHSP